MQLERIKRRYWIVLAIIIGTAGGWLHRVYDRTVLSSWGEGIVGQRVFEEALQRDVQGQRQFHDLMVYATFDDDAGGGMKRVYVIRGIYCDERQDPGGQGRIVWRPAFYVAHTPYRPTSDLGEFRGTGEVDYSTWYRGLAHPTILEYLRILRETRDVRFVHAWWRDPLLRQSLWLGGSVLIVG